MRVKDDEQLYNVFVYVHANRISLIEPGWKEKGIKNHRKVIEFLTKDKWHSFPDYIGGKAFPSVTSRDFISKTIGGSKGYEQAIVDWVEYKRGFGGCRRSPETF